MTCVAVVPVIDRAAANAAMAAKGFGPNNFNAKYPSDGIVTHYYSVHHEDVYSGCDLPASVIILSGEIEEILSDASFLR